MANVPTATAPDIQQSGASLGITPESEAFGAKVLGQGLQGLGAATQQAGQEYNQLALQQQDLVNKQAADAATNKAIVELDKYGANWVTSNNGATAKDNLDSGGQDLHGIVEDQRGNLSPVASQMYNTEVRRYAALTFRTMQIHASTEFNKSAIQDKKDGIDLLEASAVGHGDDPVRVELDKQLIAYKLTELGSPQYLGLSRDQIEYEIKTANGRINGALIRQALANQDQPKAQALYQQAVGKGELNVDQQNQLVGELRTGSAQYEINSMVSDIYNSHGAPKDYSGITGVANAGSFYHDFELPHEGTALVTDANGYPVRMGVNAKAHPEVNLQTLTEDQAAQIYGQNYDNPSLQGGIRLAYGDTAWMSGKDIADRFLQQSGGDVDKFLALREQYQAGLAKEPKYAKYGPTWEKRTQDLSTYIKENTGTGQTFNTPPPTFQPNEDPNGVLTKYLSYNQQVADWLSSTRGPGVANAFLRAADARAQLVARQQAASQKDTYDSGIGLIVNGLPNGNAVHSLADVPPNILHGLDNEQLNSLSEKINLSNLGVGGYKSPEMEANFERLKGLSMTDEKTFADPTKTDLTKVPLSASDYSSLSSLQGSLHRQEAKQDAKTTQFKSILNDAIIKDYRSKIPSANLDGDQLFVGRLQAELEAIHPDGKYTVDEARTVAGSLMTRGANGRLNYQQPVPPAAAQAITSEFIRQTGRAPKPWELSAAYDRLRGQQ